MNKLNLYIGDVLTSPGKRTARHFLLQGLLLAITSGVLWAPGSDSMPSAGLFLVWAIYYLAVNILVYLNIYRLTGKYLLAAKPGKYLLAVSGLVCMLIVVIGILQSLAPDAPGTSPATPPAVSVISSIAAVGLLFAGTSSLVLFREWIISDRRRTELETLNLDAELRMLKNQINPHFLFNMLNNCYLLVKKGRKDAPGVLFRLEELLRYQVGSASGETVSLKDEIGFLEDLLNLEKLRRDRFRFSVTDRTCGRQILLPPMILIPFVENAIKHNTDGENPSFVDISFEDWEKGIIFRCVNSKPSVRHSRGGGGGLGLRNIGRRLELLFPLKHELTVTDSGGEYGVKLKLEL